MYVVFDNIARFELETWGEGGRAKTPLQTGLGEGGGGGSGGPPPLVSTPVSSYSSILKSC